MTQHRKRARTSRADTRNLSLSDHIKLTQALVGYYYFTLFIFSTFVLVSCYM